MRTDGAEAGSGPSSPHLVIEPLRDDAEVARTKLAALGVALDVLTPAQAAYLSTWQA